MVLLQQQVLALLLQPCLSSGILRMKLGQLVVVQLLLECLKLLLLIVRRHM